MSPGLFMPAAPLTHGRWTIVACHETIERSGATLTKLCYCFASLDAEGNTLLLDAAGFLRECMQGRKADEVEACVERWENDVEMLRQGACTERSAYAVGADRDASVDTVRCSLVSAALRKWTRLSRRCA